MIKYLTAKETAKLFNVSSRRILSKIKQGHFPNATRCRSCACHFIAVKDIAETFEKKDIEAFIKKNIKEE